MFRRPSSKKKKLQLDKKIKTKDCKKRQKKLNRESIEKQFKILDNKKNE